MSVLGSKIDGLHIGSNCERSFVVVVLVWAALFIVALGLVYQYGTRTLPQADELWALYDAGPGIHVHWLWKTWAEHRIPLAKLIWKAVLQVTGYDFRAGNLLTVLALGSLAIGMVRISRRRRGRTIIADAFFPLAILNFGQAQVFLWWWQVNHVLAPITASLLLSVLVLHANDLQPAHARLIGAGLILLVLCGPGGLPYVLALAVWLGIWAAMKWSSFGSSQRKQCLSVLMLVCAALALTVFYFVDYTPFFPVNDPPSVPSWALSPGPMGTAIASLQILGLSLGTATKPYAALCGFAVFILGCASFAVLISTLRNHANERSRALGLLTFLAAAGALVLTIGRARAGMGLDYIYQGQYLTLVVPALCCIYFVWETRGGLSGRSVQLGMALVLAALLPLNLQHAIESGHSIQQKTIAFEHDVGNGIPGFVLAERHFASDVVPRTEKLAQIVASHKAAGIGIFKQIRDDPPFQVEALDPQTAIPDQMVLHDGIATSMAQSKGTSSLTFALGEPRHVYAIRLRYAYLKTANLWPALRAFWRRSAMQDFNERASLVSAVAGPDQPTWALIDGKIRTDAKVRTERTLTIWIDAPIDQFRIYPDSVPCEFRLSKIELLVPIRSGI